MVIEHRSGARRPGITGGNSVLREDRLGRREVEAYTASLLLAALWWAAGPALPVRAATRTVSVCDEGHLRSAISGAAMGYPAHT